MGNSYCALIQSHNLAAKGAIANLNSVSCLRCVFPFQAHENEYLKKTCFNRVAKLWPWSKFCLIPVNSADRGTQSISLSLLAAARYRRKTVFR